MEDRRLAIIFASVAFLLIILGFLLMPGKGKKNIDDPSGKNTSKLAGKNGKEQKNGGSGFGKNNGSASSSGNGSYGKSFSSSSSAASSAGFTTSDKDLVPKKTYTEEEMQELRRQREQLRSQVYQRKLKWVQDKMNDENLSAKSRYRYRLKLIEGYRTGNEAFNNGNYVEAMKEYMKALKDPEANPETTFICLTQMRMTAKLLKDYDLYLELMKQQTKLIETENLSVFGIEKGTSGVPLYESRRRFVMAIKEPGGIDRAVSEIIKENKLEESDQEEIKKQFLADLDEFQKDFESARSQIGVGEGT